MIGHTLNFLTMDVYSEIVVAVIHFLAPLHRHRIILQLFTLFKICQPQNFICSMIRSLSEVSYSFHALMLYY